MTTTNSGLPISLEFFPPKTPEGVDKLAAVRQKLYALKPQYCSVTYGAGGSTQDGTMQAVQAILSEGVDAAPHFSCIGADKASIRRGLQQFKEAGIQRIVALRGDLPSGYGGFGEFRYASDLVAFIRAETGDHFHIEVAAYPEMHPQARSLEADLQAFVTKVKAGADAAITQYFFNSDAYFRFVDDVRRLGIDVPIVPGVMPISNFSQLRRFSEACGAEIPRWIGKRMQAYGDDVDAIRGFAADFVADLCRRLVDGGAPGLHFYTLNLSKPTLNVLQRLR